MIITVIIVISQQDISAAVNARKAGGLAVALMPANPEVE
jgi:hypothetical protein